jgi:VanZ family protein
MRGRGRQGGERWSRNLQVVAPVTLGVRLKVRWLLLGLWAAVVFVTSCFHIPTKVFVQGVIRHSGGRVQQAEFNSFWREWWWLFVKGYHVLEFAILCGLLIWCLKPPLGSARAVIWAVLIAFLYACSDEWHQTFVRDRGGRWTDVAIDMIGITAVVGAWSIARPKHPKCLPGPDIPEQ